MQIKFYCTKFLSNTSNRKHKAIQTNNRCNVEDFFAESFNFKTCGIKNSLPRGSAGNMSEHDEVFIFPNNVSSRGYWVENFLILPIIRNLCFCYPSPTPKNAKSEGGEFSWWKIVGIFQALWFNYPSLSKFSCRIRLEVSTSIGWFKNWCLRNLSVLSKTFEKILSSN